MNKKLIIMSVCFGFVSAAGAAVNFDQGVDVKSAIKEASVSDIKIPEAKASHIVDITRDCKKITFGATDPLTSPEVALTSRETTQECQNMGYPAGQICIPNTKYYNETVKVVITEPRVLQPDQKEVFEVCLWGSFLNLKQVSPAYKYSVRQFLGVFELTPPAATDAKSVTNALDVCVLTMDTDAYCVYRCKDGSIISKPNPFSPPSSSPGASLPMHGCSLSVPNMLPMITIN